MRRLAAVFASKRDKSDSQQSSAAHSHPQPGQSLKNRGLKLPLAINSLPSPSVHTPSSTASTPQLSLSSDHAQSSGSSSGSASLTLATPDDDVQSIAPAQVMAKRSWKVWLGRKRSELLKQPDPPKEKDRNRVAPAPTMKQPYKMVGGMIKETNANDEDSLEVDDGGFSPVDRRIPLLSPAKARQNLELLIHNGLAPTPMPTPFVQYSAGYLFPRSCNQPQVLPPIPDMRREMFRRRLLKRLEYLSPEEEQDILPFACIASPVPVNAMSLSTPDAIHPPRTARIFSASPGIRRWISRPCFEDRFAVYLLFPDGFNSFPVVGPALGVAALEYSEFLDVMVDPDFDPSSTQFNNPLDVSWTVSSNPSAPNHPVSSAAIGDAPSAGLPPINTRHSYISSPSPLRNQHGPEITSMSPPDPPPLSPPNLSNPSLASPASFSSTPPAVHITPRSYAINPTPQEQAPTAPQRTMATVPIKRAVRFTEENDSEDVIPLHLLRQRKKRQEKAKFLRVEARRRLMEQEQVRRKQEQERQRLEVEAIEKEKARLAREKERRQAEQRIYAEEVAAARLRRESQRTGGVPSLRNRDSALLTVSPSHTSLRQSERNHPRDSKRSSLISHQNGSTASISRRDGSDGTPPSSASISHGLEPTSYMRGSYNGHSPVGSNSGHGHSSRTGSMYSTSDDGWLNNKRRSTTPHGPSSYVQPYPVLPGGSSSLQNIPFIPAVPPSPDFLNDALLLPPSAPFMMGHHPRHSRHSSPGPSISSGSLRGTSARSSSSDRANIYRQSSHGPSGSNSAPTSPAILPYAMDSKPTHSRHGSADSKRSSMPTMHDQSPKLPTPRSQSSSLPKGHSAKGPSHTMHGIGSLQHNPWTALPTRQGTLPTAMPHSVNLNGSKGGTTTRSTQGKGPRGAK